MPTSARSERAEPKNAGETAQNRTFRANVGIGPYGKMVELS